jgi:hypothetical protein
LTAVSAVFVSLTVAFLFRLPALLGAFALWPFWIMTLYLSMTVSRALGLFYRRNAAKLGWFSERPQWGTRGT